MIQARRKTQRWNNVRQLLENTPKTHLNIWRTDANVQLGNRNRNKPELAKIMGMGTNAEETESGNGKAIQNLCIKHEMIPMNTWRRNPGRTEHDPDSAIT